MKAFVMVCRTSTSTKGFTVEIPDGELKGMHRREITQAFADKGFAEAHDKEFADDSAEYVVTSVDVVK